MDGPAPGAAGAGRETPGRGFPVRVLSIPSQLAEALAPGAGRRVAGRRGARVPPLARVSRVRGRRGLEPRRVRSWPPRHARVVARTPPGNREPGAAVRLLRIA